MIIAQSNQYLSAPEYAPGIFLAKREVHTLESSIRWQSRSPAASNLSYRLQEELRILSSTRLTNARNGFSVRTTTSNIGVP